MKLAPGRKTGKAERSRRSRKRSEHRKGVRDQRRAGSDGDSEEDAEGRAAIPQAAGGPTNGTQVHPAGGDLLQEGAMA